MNRAFHIYFLSVMIFISCASDERVEGSVIQGEFVHQNISREYLLFTPEKLPKEAPLLLVLHGFTSNAQTIMDFSKFNDLATKNGFAVVYPQGTVDESGNTFWNVGYDFHLDSSIDDLDFLSRLVNYLQKEYDLSSENTFAAGMSNGGEMCYLLACNYPEQFRAVAPIAATMMNNQFNACDPESAMPIFALFGTDDTTTHYEGDEQNKDGWGAYKGIPSIVNFWTDRFAKERVKIDTLPDSVPQDSSYIVRNYYISTTRESDFVYYEVIGGGHDWPGAWGNEDIDTSEAIWTFFKRHLS